MEIKKETVEHVAHLARIELNQKELDRLAGQLQDILNFIDALKKVDTKDINPTSHILSFTNVLREDKPAASLPCEAALRNAPCPKGNFFGVPKVIE